jgi:hypothetical protein
VSAADSLNLVGIVVPGDRVPATAGRSVSFHNGVAVQPDPSDAQFSRAKYPALAFTS